MSVKAGSVSSAGLQFNMRAEVHLKAKELGIEIRDKETADKIQALYYHRRRRDVLRERLKRVQTMVNNVEAHVDALEAELGVQAISQQTEG